MEKLSVPQALRKANSYEKKGKVDQARELYLAVLQSFPGNKRALKGLAALPKSSIEFNDGSPPQDVLEEVLNLYNEGKLDAAAQDASLLAKKYPNAFLVWNLFGAINTGLGKIDEAAAAFKKATEVNPNNADGFNNLGLTLKKLGRVDEAIWSYDKALSLQPDYIDVFINLGNALQNKGQLDEAESNYKKAISLDPNNAKAHHNLGVILKDRGQLDEAIEANNKALSLKPDYAEAYNNLGTAFKEQGKLREALEAYNRAVSLEPNYADAFFNMANVLMVQEKFDDAVKTYSKAISIKPDFAKAYCNRANALLAQTHTDDAIESYETAILLKPDYFTAHSNLGICFLKKNQFEKAISCLEKALSLEPNNSEVHYNLGNALKEHGEFHQAINAYRNAIAHKADYAEAFNNMGVTLHAVGEEEKAINAYNTAIAIDPNYAAAHINLGNIFQHHEHFDKAIEAYEIAAALQPNNAYALAQKIHQKCRICDWNGLEEDYLKLLKLDTDDDPISPFTILTLEDAPDRHFSISQLYVNKLFQQYPRKVFAKPHKKTGRIRVAYFSSDFNEHPVSRLMSKVIESHDRNLFEIWGVSLGPSRADLMQKRLLNAFDIFVDVHKMPDAEALDKLRSKAFDIVIDLTGHTEKARTSLFAQRLAPIQINYLGYPGTMGGNFMDYIIADQNLIPEVCQKYYTEKVIYLPHHYQAQDDELEIAVDTPTKASLGLPDKGFVFCAINNTYKITKREFDIWTRLLLNVEGSVLWLLERNKWVKTNLLKEAKDRGVPPEQIVFAKKAPHAKYLAQFRQADLYLDTFNYNAGATASNALWAGLPVLTKQGKGYTARMASSLLKSIGLSELATTNETDYEKMALKLANNPDELTFIKNKLATNRKTTPLFNTKLFVDHLESAYLQVFQRYLQGNPPETVIVSA